MFAGLEKKIKLFKENSNKKKKLLNGFCQREKISL